MLNIFIFVLCLVTTGASHGVHCIQATLREELELSRQLKLINKPPIKTIHTKYGDIDCIDINKQSALDHPLLKNHKLQRKPSFRKSIRKTKSVKNLSGTPIFGLDKEQCPRGTVPIQRTTKEDLIRAKLLSNYSIFLQDIPGVHLAEVALSSKFGPYYGVFGLNSIYNPRVSKGQMSLSHVWVQNGPINSNNKISLGWHVSPELYGDHKTHLYSSWTRDNYHKTGCYNVRCPGFVQTDNKYYLGAHITNVSSYDGPLFDSTYSITQDPSTKNWWLGIGPYDIGYFPAKLFSNMNSADKVGWGGRTLTPHGSPSPPMGSGHFPDRNFYHASYFTLITFQNASRSYGDGPEEYKIEKYIDKPKCFGLSYYNNIFGDSEYSLQFGGPGGYCGD